MFQTIKTLARMFQSDDATPVRRNQTTLGLHTLEAREVPAVLANLVLDGNATVLQLTGGGSAENIRITSNGAGVITLTGDVAGLNNTPLQGIDRIEANLNGGDDRVTFEQGTSAAVVTQSRTLAVKLDLGSGDDRFTADLHGNLQSDRSLSLDVNGGGFGFDGENDRMDVKSGTAGSGFRVHERATLRVKMAGGGGDDFLQLGTEGRLDGLLLLDMSGGDGNDTMNVNSDPDSGSTGRLRGENLFGGAAPASIRGDGGSDRITFRFDLDGSSSTATTDVSLDGGISLFDNDVLEVNGDHPGSVIKIANFEQIV